MNGNRRTRKSVSHRVLENQPERVLESSSVTDDARKSRLQLREDADSLFRRLGIQKRQQGADYLTRFHQIPTECQGSPVDVRDFAQASQLHFCRLSRLARCSDHLFLVVVQL